MDLFGKLRIQWLSKVDVNLEEGASEWLETEAKKRGIKVNTLVEWLLIKYILDNPDLGA